MKVSYKGFAYLMGYKQHHPFIKYCCNRYIIERNANILMRAEVKLWIYILLFIPVHIIMLFYSLWDGGIKNYEIQERTIINMHRYTIYDEKYKNWKEQHGM